SSATAHAETRLVAQRQRPVFLQRRSPERILTQQDRTVEIRPVDEWRDLHDCGDTERTAQHAARHHAQVMRTRGVDHAQCLAQRTALLQLDVDTIDDADQPRDVDGGAAGLIRDYRYA